MWALDADAYVVRPGPRVVDGVEAIASILHPTVPVLPTRRRRAASSDAGSSPTTSLWYKGLTIYGGCRRHPVRRADRRQRRAGVRVPRGIGARRLDGRSRAGQALEVLARRFTASGFEVDRVAIPPDIGSDPVAGVPQLAYEGRYDVIARRPASDGGPSLLFNGHIDVVPPGDLDAVERAAVPTGAARRLAVRPRRRRHEGRLRHGLAGARRRAGGRPGADHAATSRVLAVIEEECTGNGTLAACRAGHLADAVVLLEPTGPRPARRRHRRVVVRARRAGQRRPRPGRRPRRQRLRRRRRARRRTRASSNGDSTPTSTTTSSSTSSHPYNFNVGELSVGDWQSSVPSRATLGVRFGFPRAWTVDEAIACVRSGRRRDRRGVPGAAGAAADACARTASAPRATPSTPITTSSSRSSSPTGDAHGEPPVSYGLGIDDRRPLLPQPVRRPRRLLRAARRRHPRHRRARRAAVDRRRSEDARPLHRRLLPERRPR